MPDERQAHLTPDEVNLDNTVKQLLGTYPQLREEILRAVVYDERDAALVRNLAHYGIDDRRLQL